MKKQVIEFFGFPGSGKTFALNELKSVTTIKCVTTDEFYRDALKPKLLVLFTFPIYIFINYKNVYHRFMILMNYKSMSLKLKIKSYIDGLFYEFLYKRFNNKYNKSIIILDQGIIQNDFSIFLKNNIEINEKFYMHYSKILNNYEKKYNINIVVFKTDIMLTSKRTSIRGSAAFVDKLGYDETYRIYKRNSDNFEKMISFVKNKCNFDGMKNLSNYINEEKIQYTKRQGAL